MSKVKHEKSYLVREGKRANFIEQWVSPDGVIHNTMLHNTPHIYCYETVAIFKIKWK
jgi:hypothetical protein